MTAWKLSGIHPESQFEEYKLKGIVIKIWYTMSIKGTKYYNILENNTNQYLNYFGKDIKRIWYFIYEKKITCNQ